MRNSLLILTITVVMSAIAARTDAQIWSPEPMPLVDIDGWTIYTNIPFMDPTKQWGTYLIDDPCREPFPFLRAPFVPGERYSFQTLAGSPFHGDWASAEVQVLEVDVRLNGTNIPGHLNVPLALVLSNVYADEHHMFEHTFYNTVVWTVSEQPAPMAVEGWVTFTFEIPSTAQALPDGWFIHHPPLGEPTADWQDIVSNVQQIYLAYGHLDGFYDTNVSFDVSFANPKLLPELPGEDCAGPADLTCDGSVGVQDLLILLANWGLCSDPADCIGDLNGNGSVGVDDLLILLAEWG